MKKLFLISLVIAFLMVTSPAFALINTENTGTKDFGTGESAFKSKVAYNFYWTNLVSTLSATEISAVATADIVKYYVMPFASRIVGVSISSSAALTAGSATADVTINSYVTGVRTAIDAGGSTRHYPSGIVAAHTQYNCQTIDWDDDSPENWGSVKHDDDHMYGRATPLDVGDQLGVKLESTSIAPATNDLIITVIVLQ